MSKHASITYNVLTMRLTNNLQYLMHKTGITCVGLAESVGVSAELIGKLKNGIQRNPSLKVLSEISNYFKVSIDDLVFNDLRNVGGNLPVKPISYIPIVDWENIKNWRKQSNNLSVIVENILGDDTFALYIDHDCGLFQKNTFIFVNANLEPKNGDYVLVLNNTNGIFHLRKLIVDDSYYLQSIILDVNNIIKYDKQNYLIYGVIIGYQNTEFFRDRYIK